MIGRREFVTLLGGAAAWPLAARAQQDEWKRVIGVLLCFKEHDPEAEVEVATFLRALEGLGWTAGCNLEIEYRWTGGDANLTRRYAAELVALAPDVILTEGGSLLDPLQQLSRTVPIVFVQVVSAAGGGFVDRLIYDRRNPLSLRLPRLSGNATGFTNFDSEFGEKSLALLKQVAPQMTRVAVLRDPTNPGVTGQFDSIQKVARLLSVEARPVVLRDADEMERGITEFARFPNGGLIVTPAALAIVLREQIIALAARYRLPAIYPAGYFVRSGGLISYGPDFLDQYRRAAVYVDRLLRGAKVSELPVQFPTKFELVINLKTAKAIGLDIAPALLARADEVIE